MNGEERSVKYAVAALLLGGVCVYAGARRPETTVEEGGEAVQGRQTAAFTCPGSRFPTDLREDGGHLSLGTLRLGNAAGLS
jgi:hypothetical protein